LISAAAFGGGVSEILYTLVPLMRNVGLDTHWQVIMGQEEFFNDRSSQRAAGDETTLTDERGALRPRQRAGGRSTRTGT
jgi:trehalose synthase